MAGGFLFEVAARIIEKADDRAFQEIALLWGVKDEIEKLRNTVSKLRNTVSTIRAVLLDAGEMQNNSNEVKAWLEKVKDAIYDADNLVDGMSTEALRQEVMTRDKKAKEVRIFFSKSNQLAYGLKMGHKVKAMREILDAIAMDRVRETLDAIARNMVRETLDGIAMDWFEEPLVEAQVGYRVRETHSLVCPKVVIGRESEKKEIIEILLDPNIEENISILPITGLGGIGKTTLAQLIFNDEKIMEHFEQRLWVCVSDNFDIKTIVEKILESAKNKKLETLEMNTLINDLKKEIDGKRYLLVLDDVWNDDPGKWFTLKALLMRGARGSGILVTTRSHEVAKIVQTIKPYSLQVLSDEQSWLLFKQMAFDNRQALVSPNHELIGKGFIRKYRGIPLTLRTIGSLLYFKNTEVERLSVWKDSYNSMLSNVSQYENGILPTLKMSYNHLPSYLKQCFVYCSLFPKDYKFHKQTLIQMWIAQGFIRSSGQNLVDVGHNYFMELLRRSFFQEVEEDEGGNILHFKIHDLTHDLAILIAGRDGIATDSNVTHIYEKTLHVSFGSLSLSQIPISLFKASKIRTFLLPSHPDASCTILDKSTYSAIVTSFKFIRLLDLHNLGIKKVPSSIGKLKHLRYLDLSYNEDIEILPNSFTRLLNLQTLKLTACTQLKKLPRDINKLVNLMYLEISDCVLLTSAQRGVLEQQLTNCRIVQQSTVGKDLRRDLLIELRHGEDAALESKAANSKEKQDLQALELHWIEDEVDEGDIFDDKNLLNALQPHPNLQVLSLYRYWGVTFPSWPSSHTNLVEFVLFGCKKCEHLPPLDQFHNLRVLELDSLRALKSISERDNNEEFSNSSFLPSLKELKLKYCPNLKGWWQGMTEKHLLPSFPHLSKLCIRGCLQLTSMPLFPYLRNLELYYCSFKPLEQTTRMEAVATVASTSSSSSILANSSFAPLSKLTSLEIGRMKEPLPEECLQNLVSLGHLLIYECRGPLLQGIRHLTALKKLDICSSEVFDLPNDGNGMEWQYLRSLSSLCLFQLELESFPVGLQHITSLQNLMLDYCPNLNVIPVQIYNLTSLQSLEILQCPKLKSLPVGICGLTSLHTLNISKCLNFTSFPQDMSGLATLQTLHISECFNLTSLPKGMCGLTSLQTLEISKLLNFTSFPEWMGDFSSLKTLYILECPKLTSFPKAMRRLTALQTLCIQDCPILAERCKRETGEDWAKISHIRNLLSDQLGRKLLVEESNEAPMEPNRKKCWCLIRTFGCCNCSISQQPTE